MFDVCRQEYAEEHPIKSPSGAFFCLAQPQLCEAERSAAVFMQLLRLLLLLLAAALAAVAWGFVDYALPAAGLSPRAQQAAATALLLVAATNAAAGREV